MGILGVKTPVVYLVIFGFINSLKTATFSPFHGKNDLKSINVIKKGKNASINTSCNITCLLFLCVSDKIERAKITKRLKRLKRPIRLKV